jgi:hypothetical protein
MKRHGHFCRICGCRRPNEQFSGRGHRIHVCKECQRLPKGEIKRIEALDELHGFLDQSNISARNVERLKILSGRSDPEVAGLASLLLDIARVLPGKRNRWRKLATRNRDLFDRAVKLLGVDSLTDLLAGYRDFENPVWAILEKYGSAHPWTDEACSCGSGRPFRNCCMQREDEWADANA